MEENKESVIMEIPDGDLTEMISINVICRLCANQNDKLIGIYSEDGINNDLANKMNVYLPIKVNESDELPLQCCWQCASTVLAWHDLVITSVEADRRLRSYQFITEKQVQNVQTNFETEESIPRDKQNELLPKLEDQTQIKKEEFMFLNEDRFNFVDYDDSYTETDSKEFSTRNRSKCLDDLPLKGLVNFSEKRNANMQLKIEYQNAVNLESKTCNLCMLSFRTKILLKKHMSEQHSIKQPKYRRKKSEIDATFICPLCNKSFTRKFDMQKHILNKHPTQKNCVLPSKRSKNLEILERCKIYSSEGSYYKCDLCEQKFQKSRSLIRHRNVHTCEKSHCCHICGRTFLVSTALICHINQFHYGVKKFSCNICEKLFSSKTTKDEHMNIHTNSRPFVCDTCGKSFKQKSTLHIHKMFHSNNFRFSCNVCDKKFRRKQDLKVHQWVHTGEKPHQCKICKMTFRLRQNLKRHLKVHDEYLCGDCGLKFDQERFLKLHRKIHEF